MNEPYRERQILHGITYIQNQKNPQTIKQKPSVVTGGWRPGEIGRGWQKGMLPPKRKRIFTKDAYRDDPLKYIF